MLVFVYGIFAFAATGRSTLQLTTEASKAPVPYSLSAFAAVVYIVATFAMATNRRRLALVTVGIELVGVLAVGVTSLLLPEDYPDATVWSDFGAGYGFVPLVLPVVGLWWLLRQGREAGRDRKVSVTWSLPVTVGRRTLALRLVTDAPIGIFDSGFGGLTVARAVMDQLPHEAVVYLGDTARQPYGPKPIGEVREYALECLDHLVDQGVKALVIACNSASAAMLRDARERYDVPVVEVILPADPSGGRRHPQRPHRRHLHPGDRAVAGLRGRLRRGAAGVPDHPGLPALRRLRRALA